MRLSFKLMNVAKFPNLRLAIERAIHNFDPELPKLLDQVKPYRNGIEHQRMDGLSLYHLALLLVNIEAFKSLLRSGFSPNILDRDLRNIIHYAVTTTDPSYLQSIFQELLPEVVINLLGQRSKDNLTPLTKANQLKNEVAYRLISDYLQDQLYLNWNNLSVIRKLVENGADPARPMIRIGKYRKMISIDSPFRLAWLARDFDILEFYLTKARIDFGSTGPLGLNYLHQAILANDEKMFELFSKSIFFLKNTNMDKHTPFLFAVRLYKIDYAIRILDTGYLLNDAERNYVESWFWYSEEGAKVEMKSLMDRLFAPQTKCKPMTSDSVEKITRGRK